MLIVLFVVSTLFGSAAMILWAMLASARLKLKRAEQLSDELMKLLAEQRRPEPAQWDELTLLRDEAFGSRTAAAQDRAGR